MQGYVHRVLVIDRSGSIGGILAGQQSGLEEFFSSEQEVALRGDVVKATYSLWDFDTEIRRLYSFAQLGEVRGYKIEPRGGTALYDAVAQAVIAEGSRLAVMDEAARPQDVTVIISSDGQENSSREYPAGGGGGPRIAKMLTRQQEAYAWRVLYMGTNQDAFAEGAKIGLTVNSSLSYTSSAAGSAGAWRGSAHLLSRAPVATASAGGYAYTDEERRMAVAEDGEDDSPNP
jgi:hypothetical protein